jgi:muramidase (phage lysozyme)
MLTDDGEETAETAETTSGTVNPATSVSGTQGAGDSNIQTLLTTLAAGESKDYTTVYGDGKFISPNKPVTEMTFNELYDFQRQLIAATRGKVPNTSDGTSAVGRYQFVASTLFGRGRGPNNPVDNSVFAMSGLSPNDKYTPENQERLIRTLLETQGNLSGFLAGRISADDFQDRLASIFASVKTMKDERSGTSRGAYNQGATTGRAQLDPVFDKLRTQGAGEESIIKNGREIYLPNKYVVPMDGSSGAPDENKIPNETGAAMSMNNGAAMSMDPEFQVAMGTGPSVSMAAQTVNKVNYQRVHIDDTRAVSIQAFA